MAAVVFAIVDILNDVSNFFVYHVAIGVLYCNVSFSVEIF